MSTAADFKVFEDKYGFLWIENEFGEVVAEGIDGMEEAERWIDNRLQNEAEAAWERHCEAFHDGGSPWPKSLQEQQTEARRLK